MQIELVEIRDFLAAHHPFDALPESSLAQIPGSLLVRYLRRSAAFPPQPAADDALYVVRRGAVELRDGAGELVDKLGEGDFHAADNTTRTLSGIAVEDTLLYVLPRARLAALRSEHPDFDRLFTASIAERISKALVSVKRSASGGTLINIEVGELVARSPVCAASGTSVRAAAVRMREHRISSLLIVDADRLIGIVTDRDLRNRCVAEGFDVDRPVRDIMTATVHSISKQAPAFEALMLMARLNVHHLPVMDRSELVGVISASDLIRHESANAVYLVGEVRKAPTAEAMIEQSQKLHELHIRLASSDATARHVGEAVTAVSDAITVRLIELAESDLGPAPMPYAWVAGGSQARKEQTSHSDQDNALILADDPTPQQAGYFAALAQKVNDGLNACGFIYCPGEVMAGNPKWRQPLRIWRQYFDDWIDKPDPTALMLSSVFFDLRVIYGDSSLLLELQRENLAKTAANGIFLVHMAGNALQHRPPLGFFRNLVLISGGEHDRTLDLKHRGVVPVVDLARVYALADGVMEINTLDRLHAAAGGAAISSEGARSLADAYELIATLRMRHQAIQLRSGSAPDNFLAPQELSALERAHLKDAFALISEMQRILKSRYPTARFF